MKAYQDPTNQLKHFLEQFNGLQTSEANKERMRRAYTKFARIMGEVTNIDQFCVKHFRHAYVNYGEKSILIQSHNYTWRKFPVTVPRYLEFLKKNYY